MRFTKLQGLGNDYVYVNAFEEPLPDDLPALARKISDRHFGVGGDGLIVIGPSAAADARMRMFNADGSESEMCGNGVRCVAKYVYDHGIARKSTLQIETGRGVLALDVETYNDRVRRVRVDMGEPILRAADNPTTLPSRGPGQQVIDAPLPAVRWPVDPRWTDQVGLVGGSTCVSMGNPHVIYYCRQVAQVPLAALGPVLETAAEFPRRINVHFVEVHHAGEVTMRTWERGSGITLACGTGAAAVCVAGVLTGRSARQIVAHLPGGDLELAWDEASNHVFMTGPAVEVFSGDWNE